MKQTLLTLLHYYIFSLQVEKTHLTNTLNNTHTVPVIS